MKFVQLFRKVGGKNILKQYLYGHVLIFAFIETALLGFSKKSLEIVRLAVNHRIFTKLRKKNRAVIKEYLIREQAQEPRKCVRSNKVWVCWLQGMEKAPELVKKCFESLQEHLKDREIILLTEKNYRDYVTFPEHIQSKIDKGIITNTHMSDLLRLELLLNYGGTWMDATVYCSGGDYPDYMLDSDLFFFQNLKPGLDGHCTSISSWMLTACTNHPVLRLTRELLYHYWKKHDHMVDYFLFHDFFQMSLEVYPQEWKKVVPSCNATPHILLLRLFEQYEDSMWNAVREMCAFHKLSYKFEAEKERLSNTYYRKLIKGE